MLFLQSHRAFFFYLQLVGLLLPCVLKDISTTVRLTTAISYTLYHLTESSMLNRHGEYPILYIMWTNCILQDEQYRAAAGLGITINFILSTGYAKTSIGGLMDWLHPNTMRAYLSCHGNSKRIFNRPLWLEMNRMICHNNVALSATAVMTILLECVIAPAAILMPHLRWMVCLSMVAMHVGITLTMSIKVGISFITSVPAYFYGLACTYDFNIGSGPWIVAAAIGLLPTLTGVLVGHSIISENWPFTPVSLFMWSHYDATALLDLFMVKDTRLVLVTASVASKGTKRMIGMKVLHNAEKAGEGERRNGCVHDAVQRTFGFTLLQGGQRFVSLVKSLRRLKSVGKDAEMHGFVSQTQQFLVSDKRLFEAHSGECLVYTFFVRVDERMCVAEVLCQE